MDVPCFWWISLKTRFLLNGLSRFLIIFQYSFSIFELGVGNFKNGENGFLHSCFLFRNILYNARFTFHAKNYIIGHTPCSMSYTTPGGQELGVMGSTLFFDSWGVFTLNILLGKIITWGITKVEQSQFFSAVFLDKLQLRTVNGW